jgi:hypothetical protein
MPKVDLPGGRHAVIALRMAEFRQLWASGAVQKLQGIGQEGSDLGETYPLLATAVRSWDCTDANGNALDPAQVASYDELEPSVFMRLMTALAQYVGGADSKN